VLISTTQLLQDAQKRKYAIGAFNVYNLEGVMAVIAAAEAERSPAMLQLHPPALDFGKTPLTALCLEAARTAPGPMAVHLDHSPAVGSIQAALRAGITSIMADGSRLPYADNLAFTRSMAELVHHHNGSIEAELGRLSGSEDGLTELDYEALLTAPEQAAHFVTETGIDSLAVCIGNVHGHYSGLPNLDFARLAAIRKAVSVPLVLHGASGLPDDMIRQAIELGVCKFNVNTEVRGAYLAALKTVMQSEKADLLDVMRETTVRMQAVVTAKLRAFGSTAKAG